MKRLQIIRHIWGWSTLTIVMILCPHSSFGRDYHYTLAQLSPVRLNPALSGVYDYEFDKKDIRFTSHYRDQWRTVNSKWSSNQTPFSTSAIGLDGQLKTRKKHFGDYGGWGLQLLYDQAGDLKLSSSEIAFSFAYHKSLNSEATSYLSIGGSYTFVLRRIDFNDAVFDNQWNGIDFDPDLPTGEYLSNSNFNFDDIKAGINYHFYPEIGPKFSIGYSLHHINRPEQTFFATGEDKTLAFNNIGHGTLEIPFHPRRSIVATGFYQNQAGGNEAKIAGYYKVKFEEDHHKKQFIQLGLGLRQVGGNDDFTDSDAFYIAGRYRYGSAIFSFAYDTNISGLIEATSSVGAFEISIIYYEDLYRRNIAPRKRPGKYKPKCPEPPSL